MEFKMGLQYKSAFEIFCVVAPTFFLSFVSINLAALSAKRWSWVRNFTFEIFMVILPLLTILTVLVHYVILVNLLLIATCVFVVLFSMNCSDTNAHVDEDRPYDVGKKAYITNTRSSVNILTAIAILAVDFNVFPGRFHKTHKYGFSLMDVGVGAFVFANGIVAPEIRGHRHSIWKTFTSVAPLLVIGIGRFLLTWQTHYGVNVSEYGVHWNFFITLAVTRLVSATILSVTKCSMLYCGLEGIGILAFHQLLLDRGLETFVFSSVDRDTFLRANREGIISTLGYIGMYLLSVSFGFLVNNKDQLKLHFQLIGSTMFLGITTFVLYYFFNVSRTLANSTYCVWILFICILLMSMYYVGEEFCAHFYARRVPCAPFIFEAINYNGLLFFIVANLLTGLVNMVFETRKISNLNSMFILGTYLTVTSLLVSLLYVNKIKLKL